MRRFECNQCDNPSPCVCYAYVTDVIMYKNGCECDLCHGKQDYKWEEIKSEALPKLTAEALKERGIEWPEWATCAVVNGTNIAFFVEHKGAQFTRVSWTDVGRTGGIPGRWDASDWPNSKIVRPTVKDSLTVPEWCKVGEWIFEVTQKKFHRIKALNFFDRRPVVTWDDQGDGYIGSCGIQHLRPARMLPWTKEDGPLAMKLKYKGAFAVASMCNHAKDGWEYAIVQNGSLIHVTMADIAENGVQLDGSPCGVLEAVE